MVIILIRKISQYSCLSPQLIRITTTAVFPNKLLTFVF